MAPSTDHLPPSPSDLEAPNSQIPPDAIGSPPEGSPGTRLSKGATLIRMSFVVPTVVFFLLLLSLEGGILSHVLLLGLGFLLVLGACTWLPLFWILKGRKTQRRGLWFLGNLVLILSGLAGMALGLGLLYKSSSLNSFGMLIVGGELAFAFTQLTGVYLLNASDP